MDHPLFVSVGETPCHLYHAVDDLLRGQHPPAPQNLLEILSLQVLHDNVRGVLVLVGIEGADDVGVVEKPDNLHFAEEPRDGKLRGCTDRQYDLEGDQAIQQPMPGLEYAPHGSDTETVEQHVTSENEALGFPNQQAAGLKLRQPALLDEPLGQRG